MSWTVQLPTERGLYFIKLGDKNAPVHLCRIDFSPGFPEAQASLPDFPRAVGYSYAVSIDSRSEHFWSKLTGVEGFFFWKVETPPEYHA